MGPVGVAALAGYACALLFAWAAPRLERWWEPSWRGTRWAFAAARATPAAAALFAAAARQASRGGAVADAAAAGLAWLTAQAYVLLLQAARR